ncbi:hypothetical protein Y1Q_0015553 [Alligator mississippiensis]|uniref:Uncharacterized protein n=1 Tax=Alligator mississippiensis TaxID=8496 RepID=A0A151NN82_ALLMI|nr:hypothetical protein Y1Q_0015553 [Alligator mississippiensis]
MMEISIINSSLPCTAPGLEGARRGTKEDLLLFKRKLSAQLVKKELKNLDCFSALELDKGYTGVQYSVL